MTMTSRSIHPVIAHGMGFMHLLRLHVVRAYGIVKLCSYYPLAVFVTQNVIVLVVKQSRC